MNVPWRGTGNERDMTREGDGLRTAAVRNLTALGLSEYAARTLVALTRIDGGSALSTNGRLHDACLQAFGHQT